MKYQPSTAKDGTGSPAGSAPGATDRRPSLDHYGPVEEDRAMSGLEADLAVTPDPFDVDEQHYAQASSIWIPRDAFDEPKPVVSHELLALLAVMAFGAALLIGGSLLALAVFT